MARYVFDIETNGLLDTMDRIHCIVAQDVDTGQMFTGRSDKGLGYSVILEMLMGATELIGHNIIDFDIPAIQKVHPEWKPCGKITDTLVVCKLIWPHIAEIDWKKLARNPNFMPKQLTGRQGLEAWGHRLGFHKGDYAKEMKEQGLDPWAEVNDRMVDYCENDVLLNVKLWELIQSKDYSQQSIDLEHAVHLYCREQTAVGCSFNEPAAGELYAALSAERERIAAELKDAFGSWLANRGTTTPKRSMHRFVPCALGSDTKSTKKDGFHRGYYEEITEEAVYSKIALCEFNPASRDHIAERLTFKYGWKPKAYTDKGKPTIDEQVLSGLKYPEASLLQRYLLVEKRLGQISEGNKAWLKLVKNGRIHGRINTNGAVTGRATHNDPNLAQVPKVGSPWGAECRALFRATPGWTFVGADASGLELRCLAHYMGRWDGGAYGDAVVNGSSDDGTDVHSLNCVAIGFNPKELYTVNGKQAKGRDIAKTFIYAFLYGAGDAKIGSIVGKGRKHGAELKARFLAGLPALGNLVKGVAGAAISRGYMVGLDGRHLMVRHGHAALNTLLQGAGAIIMKQAMVNWHELMAAKGYIRGVDYRQILWVHDEFQAECRNDEIAHACGSTMVEAIRKVTTDFNLRCPLDGEFKIGANWAETH